MTPHAPPTGPKPGDRPAHLLWPDERGVLPASGGPPRRRAPKLRVLWRARPLPLALAVAAGLGPLAWALDLAFPESTVDAAAFSGPDAGPAAVSGPDAGPASVAPGVTGAPVSADHPWAALYGIVPMAPPVRPQPAGTDDTPVPPAAAPAAPAMPEWGTPLPGVVLSPSAPPDTTRRHSGRVVLASTYVAQTAPADAQRTPTLWLASATPGLPTDAPSVLAAAGAGPTAGRPEPAGDGPPALPATPTPPAAGADAASAGLHAATAPLAAAAAAAPRPPSAPATDAAASPREPGPGARVAWLERLRAGVAQAVRAARAAVMAEPVMAGPAAVPRPAAPTLGPSLGPSPTLVSVAPTTTATATTAATAATAAATAAASAAATATATASSTAGPASGAPAAVPPPFTPRGARLGELPELLELDVRLRVDDARPVDAGPALSLQQAVDRALARHPEVLAAQARRDAFGHTRRAALGALLPQGEARAGIGSGTLESVNPAETRHRKEGAVTLRQALVDVPAWRELDRQGTLVRAADWQYQAAVSSVALEVATVYIQALQARMTLTLTQRHEQELNRVLLIMTERANGGVASAAERSRVSARVSNARAQMADARATLRGALRRLGTLVGEVPVELTLQVPAGLAVPEDGATALALARQGNAELLAGRAEAVAAAYEAQAYRARLLPRLEAEVQHLRTTNPGGSAGYTRDTKGMVMLNWQFLSGGSDLAQARAAQARERERGYRTEDVERRFEQDLDTLYASLDSVATRYAALRDELLANAQVVSAFNLQLTNGNRPLLDVLDAYQRQHANRLELASLLLGELQNQLRVAQITGQLGRDPAPTVGRGAGG
jgi:adhesin transport system outer membrane protein